MNNNQRVLVCSLAMILCLVVATVTANEADEAKAAALLAEMLYPEYANSPEIQAILKQAEKRGKTGFASFDVLGMKIPSVGDKRATFPAFYSLENKMKLPGGRK
ncbi:uncharacterized protein [Amphiura filiformis]|uniref:uncharacterized protein isoform X2 n=1 Tax=Amphiura filiformis TaxID=82378 RepID=UPI003B20F5AB